MSNKHTNLECEKNWPSIVVCVLLVISLGVLYMIAKTQIELEETAKPIPLPVSKEARKD